MKKPNINTIISLFFIVLSLSWFSLTRAFPNTPTEIGSGFFPAICCGVMFLASVILLIQNFSKSTSDNFQYNKKDMLRVLSVIAITVIYILSLSMVGYVVSTIIMLLAVMLIFGMKNKILLLSIGVGFPSVIYFVFQKLLLVQLP